MKLIVKTNGARMNLQKMVYILLVALFTAMPVAAQLRSLSSDIDVLQYYLDDKDYDGVILKVNELLQNGDVSYEDEGTIISYKVEALFWQGQFGAYSQDFEAYAKGFPRSTRLPYLYYLEMGSRFNRRHYYESIESGDMGLRTAKGLNRKNDNKILKKAAQILEDNILDNQLYTLYDNAHRKMKTTLVTEMIARGLEPPIDSSLLIPEYDDIWRDRATSNYFRGSVLAGTAFPFLGMNEKYNESDPNPVYPKVGNAFTVDFTGLYRILNGVAVGANLTFSRWSAETYARIPPSSGGSGDSIQAFENTTLYLGGLGVVRIYLPKIKKNFQIYLEPGAGVAQFANWEDMGDGDLVFTAKGSVGFTFNRTFEMRASYNMVKANGYDGYWETNEKEIYQWIGASVGIVLRRYSSKGRRKGGSTDLSDSYEVEEIVVDSTELDTTQTPAEEEVTDGNDDLMQMIEEAPEPVEPEVEEAPEPIEPIESSIFDDFK